ncbi:MAG: alpha/beta fold hydrolase [Tannerellaceae bacterium]|jgi:pimeloyl-ACP methyl ester carboxylesterase|nr:alpha/beta fold hydrolase [Tannerellaceae bacterium]
MKKSLITLFACIISLSIYGQDIAGQWIGKLSVQGIQLRLVFHITATSNGYSATMDSPDQGAKGIPVTSVTLQDKALKISITNAGIEYEGSWNGTDSITGTFKQSGLTFPLDLSRTDKAEAIVKRPQEPTEPYPYLAEDVAFENTQDGVTLAGTLTMPETGGKFPAAVLISGSGAQNRDEEMMGHKPFWILADFLTRNGIAVLRFDDRGVGASTGDFAAATSFDFSKDAEAAVKYLQSRKEIDAKKIGLIGHSEGGVIAPMLAARSGDIGFIVMLAGTGVRGDKVLLSQQEAIGRASDMNDEILKAVLDLNGKAFEIVINNTQPEELRPSLISLIKEADANASDEAIGAQINSLLNPWIQYFLKYDPAPALKKVKCPVLALNGEKDLQVLPKINLEAIGNALSEGGNRNVTLKELPGLNHLFQECTSGLPLEYSSIEQTFSPAALDEILKWLLQITS